MTYKEIFLLISKCLTISHNISNLKLIKERLKRNDLDWDLFIRLGSSHLLLPTIYSIFKTENLLKYLPDDLQTYLNNISGLNNKRNIEILNQAKRINKLLKSNNISPVFIKGTSNLIDKLYNNSFERMIGDIDLIVSKDEYSKTVKILSNSGYFKKKKLTEPPPHHRHYPRLIKKNEIAAVEVHKEFVIEKYISEFNYNSVKKNIRKVDGFLLLDFHDQLVLSVISKQINDFGYYYNDLSLRSAYDVFLISKKINVKKAISSFKYLYNPLNCFLVTANYIFGDIKSLHTKKNFNSERHLIIFKIILSSNKIFRNFYIKFIDLKLYFSNIFSNLKRFIFSKEYRIWKINKELKKLTSFYGFN